MTLHTRVAILDPVNVHELFEWGNRNLLKLGDRVPVTYDKQDSMIDCKAWIAAGRDYDKLDEFSQTIEDGKWTIGNELGQGFDAIFDIDYRTDGPLYPNDTFYDSEEELENPACFAMMSFDTAYGYNDDGVGCGDLHARYIVQLWHHLAEKDVRLRWYNEFDGEWYDTLEDLDNRLTRSGHTAVDWFNNMVKPAIAAAK
jgi:hypothetical protein